MPLTVAVKTAGIGGATHRTVVRAITGFAGRTHHKDLSDRDLAHCLICCESLSCTSASGDSTDGRFGNPLDEGDEKGTPGESRGRKAAGPKRRLFEAHRHASRAAERTIQEELPC
jgi:hypothetical protein